MPTGLEEFRARLRADKKQGRRILLVSALLFLGLIVLCISVRNVTTDYGYTHTLTITTPWKAVRDIYVYIKCQLISIFIGVGNNKGGTQAWIDMMNSTDITHFENLQQLILTILAGAVLSLSGAVYQSAMRNPMAVPTMLGVNSGVNLAQALMIGTCSSQILNMLPMYYAASYLITACVVALILLCGKVAGGKHMSVVDMLLAGTIINRLLNLIVNYLRDAMGETNLLLYEEISEKAYESLNALVSIGIMLGVCILILTPLFAMRFSMNAISFEDEDARCLGIRPNLMRLYAIIAGAILTTAAMIHYGNIGMLALLVPHMCRYVFGADFRKVLLTSAFYGAFLLTIGWYISSFTWISAYQIPVGSILSVVALPILLWFNFRQKHGWT